MKLVQTSHLLTLPYSLYGLYPIHIILCKGNTGGTLRIHAPPAAVPNEARGDAAATDALTWM